MSMSSEKLLLYRYGDADLRPFLYQKVYKSLAFDAKMRWAQRVLKKEYSDKKRTRLSTSPFFVRYMMGWQKIYQIHYAPCGYVLDCLL